MFRAGICLLAVGAGLFAESKMPAKAFPYQYLQHDYPNGLRLIAIPTDFPNLITLYIVVQAGSRNEVEPGRSGFAHLFEHMMFHGTARFPSGKYDEVLKTRGVDSNAFTSDDLTAYHMTFAKEDLATLLDLEADRFQNLTYTPEVFRTETRAVLGEYNKNSQSPTRKLDEVIRNTAFDRHTYKHTTMGFLRDIENMPNLYGYSRQFFDRYYRPEYTTVVLAGDLDTGEAQNLVGKYFGEWKRGSYQASIPAEPPQKGPRLQKVGWDSPTLPWVTVSFKGPAYSDENTDMAALDVISVLGFSETSDLYRRLVLEDQIVDTLSGSNPDHRDPYLFGAWARVKKPGDLGRVEKEILSAFEEFKTKPVPAGRLEAVKSNLRYSFLLGLNDSDAIASTVAHYVSLRRTPETINKLYDMYQRLSPGDLQRVARQYFVESGRTIVTLEAGR